MTDLSPAPDASPYWPLHAEQYTLWSVAMCKGIYDLEVHVPMIRFYKNQQNYND